jgi:hypothetical protein
MAEVQLSTADRARHPILAPIINALPVIAMIARSGPKVVAALKLNQTNRAHLAFTPACC